jgi:hypothetical protein
MSAMDFVYVCVDVFVDGRRASSGDGTYVQVSADATCKQVLFKYLETHASEYYPLLDSTIVNLWFVKLGESLQGRLACDDGGNIDITVFLDHLVSMVMSEVPTKRFMVKCARLAEDRRPRQDPIVIMMAQRSLGYVHLPPIRV